MRRGFERRFEDQGCKGGRGWRSQVDWQDHKGGSERGRWRWLGRGGDGI